MYTLLVACAVFVLVGCEARPPTNAQERAFKTYIRCLHQAARDLDDHRSGAAILAEAVAQKCSRERDTVSATLNYAPQAITTATTIVLAERNKNP